MSILKISEELLKKFKKFENDVPGKMQFVSHILSVAIEQTNAELEEDNMQNFQSLYDERDHYSDEFNDAFKIFEEKLRNLQEKITSLILNGVFGG